MVRCQEVVAALNGSPVPTASNLSGSVGTASTWKIERLRRFGYDAAEAIDLLAQLDRAPEPEADVATAPAPVGTLED